MADIVNLRIARKRAAKADRASVADANRISFGLPKSVKDIARSEAARAASSLDGRKRETAGPGKAAEPLHGPGPSDGDLQAGPRRPARES